MHLRFRLGGGGVLRAEEVLQGEIRQERKVSRVDVVSDTLFRNHLRFLSRIVVIFFGFLDYF